MVPIGHKRDAMDGNINFCKTGVYNWTNRRSLFKLNKVEIKV